MAEWQDERQKWKAEGERSALKEEHNERAGMRGDGSSVCWMWGGMLKNFQIIHFNTTLISAN